VPTPNKGPFIGSDHESNDDRLMNRTSSGALKWSSAGQKQKGATKHTWLSSPPPNFGNDDEDTTRFDVFVSVKITEARKKPGSKREIPGKIQKLPVFPMDATMPFEGLLEYIADKLKTNVQYLLLHTCEWSKKQGAKETAPLLGQSCFNAMKHSCKPRANNSVYVTIDSPHITSNPPTTHQPNTRSAEWTQGSTAHDDVQ